MNTRTRRIVGWSVVSCMVAMIVLCRMVSSYWSQELSSEGPLYIDSLALSESKAIVDAVGARLTILFPPENWDKVAAVTRQLCLDVGCTEVSRTHSRHRGPPLAFAIIGWVRVGDRKYQFCQFTFSFHDLHDRAIELRAAVRLEPEAEYPKGLLRYDEEYLIMELARRLGIEGARGAPKGSAF